MKAKSAYRFLQLLVSCEPQHRPASNTESPTLAKRASCLVRLALRALAARNTIFTRKESFRLASLSSNNSLRFSLGDTWGHDVCTCQNVGRVEMSQSSFEQVTARNVQWKPQKNTLPPYKCLGLYVHINGFFRTSLGVLAIPYPTDGPVLSPNVANSQLLQGVR